MWVSCKLARKSVQTPRRHPVHDIYIVGVYGWSGSYREACDIYAASLCKVHLYLAGRGANAHKLYTYGVPHREGCTMLGRHREGCGYIDCCPSLRKIYRDYIYAITYVYLTGRAARV